MNPGGRLTLPAHHATSAQCRYGSPAGVAQAECIRAPIVTTETVGTSSFLSS